MHGDQRRTLTPHEVAQQLQVSVATIRRLISRHELPAMRVGRQLRIPAGILDELEREARNLKPKSVA